MPQQNIFERAFELARSGQCRSMDEMRRKLKAEQFENVDAHLSGSTIKRQLADAMKMLD